MYSATLVSLALVAVSSVSAQAATDHQVVVGGSAGLVYTPSEITAAVGDTITFVFDTSTTKAFNHTVTQSAFATPCTLLKNATTGQTGFDSGFVPVPVNSTNVPSWTLRVTASTPLWAYCAQGSHCSAGMVLAINAPTTGEKTFAAYKALAASFVAGSSNSSASSSASGSASSGTPSSPPNTAGTSGASQIVSSGLAIVGAALSLLSSE